MTRSIKCRLCCVLFLIGDSTRVDNLNLNLVILTNQLLLSLTFGQRMLKYFKLLKNNVITPEKKEHRSIKGGSEHSCHFQKKCNTMSKSYNVSLFF